MKYLALLVTALSMLPYAAQADTVRPAIGKPLQQAEVLIQEQKYPEALAKIQRAAAVAHLSPYESLVIAEVRGAADSGAGNYRNAAADYQQVLAASNAPQAQQTQLIAAIAAFYYQAGDYPSTVTWVNRYIAAQGQDSRTRILLAQSYYQSGDYPHAEQAAARDVRAAQITGQAVPEAELQLLASSAKTCGDQPGYQAALRGLLTHYPSPQYWASAIGDLVATPGFPDRLMLDAYRLRRATGTLNAPGEYEDYAERAILAGRLAEARAVIAQGFASHLLSAQTDQGHAKRLQTLLAEGQPDTAGAPQTDLDQAIAAFQAGNTAAAVAAFNKIAGAANAPDAALAGLWAIRAASPVSG